VPASPFPPPSPGPPATPTDLAAKVVVRGIHLEITGAMRAHAEGGAERRLRHDEQLIRVRIDLQHDRTRGIGDPFIAKDHLEISGPDPIANVAGDGACKSLDLLADKLDRILRDRHRAEIDHRNNSRPLQTEDTAS